MVTSGACCHPGQCKLALSSSASFLLPHCIFSLVLSHSTYGADLCGSNEALLTLLGFIVIQVMRWDGPGQTVTSSNPIQAIFILRSSSQLDHLSCTTCKPDTRCPTPLPSIFWLSIFLLLPLSREELNQLGIPAWCASQIAVTQYRTLPMFSHIDTVSRQEDSEKNTWCIMEIAKPWGVNRLEGPSPNRSPFPTKIPYSIFYLNSQVFKTSEIH